MHRLTDFVSRLSGRSRERSAGAGFAISPDVIASPHQDGVVFLHTGRGQVFQANQIGARIWRGLAERESLGAVAAEIAGEYGIGPEQVERDATAFLRDLEGQGFLTRGASL